MSRYSGQWTIRSASGSWTPTFTSPRSPRLGRGDIGVLRGGARSWGRLNVLCGDLERFREQPPVVRGQAATGGELELPAVQRAGEHAVLDDAEARQVGLQMRAAPLHAVAGALEEFPLRQLLGVAALG